jgi:hypothetical protein
VRIALLTLLRKLLFSPLSPLGTPALSAHWLGRQSCGPDWSGSRRQDQGMGNVLHSLDVGVSSTHTYKMSNILVSRAKGQLKHGGNLRTRCSNANFRITPFKGTVERDFRPSVFSSINPTYRALIHVLKPFHIWLRIHRDNRFENRQ